MRMIGAIVANKCAKTTVFDSDFGLYLPLREFQRLHSNVFQGDNLERACINLGQVYRVDPSIEENNHPMRTNHLLDKFVEVGLRNPSVRSLKQRKMEETLVSSR